MTIDNAFTIDSLSSTSTVSNTATVSVTRDGAGSSYYSGSYPVIKIKLDSALASKKTFTVYAVPSNWFDNNTYQFSITIAAGATSGTYDTGWYWGVGSYGFSSSSWTKTNNFEQTVVTSGAASINANFLLANSNKYNLSNGTYYWGTLYCNNIVMNGTINGSEIENLTGLIARVGTLESDVATLKTKVS